MSQLALPLTLADHAVFSSYFAGDNTAVVGLLRDSVAAGRGPGSWVWGAPGTGRSHLLQATCEKAASDSQYIPLNDIAGADPAILEGLGQKKIVCLDDIDVVAGDADWELALFEMTNQLIDNDSVLVVSASANPRETGVLLEDLQSRLSRLPVFHLQPLDDDGRIAALRLRAAHRGLDMSDKTATFILRRSRRDMASLFRQLDKLDAASLEAKRKLSIPFVREVLEL